MKRNLTYLAVLILGIAAGCRPPTPPDTTTAVTLNPTFMFSSDEGELRMLEVEITEGDTTFHFSRYSNLGTVTPDFGKIYPDFRNSLDWTAFDSTGRPKITAILRRDNPSWNPRENTPTGQYFDQFVFVNENKRINQLQFFSLLNEKEQELQFPRPIKYSRSRTVHFADNNTLLAYYIDMTDDQHTPGNTRKRAGHLLRFSLNSSNPHQGEIIKSFNVDYNHISPTAYNLGQPQVTHLNATANGEFYILWEEVRDQGSYKGIYILRHNGTAAIYSGNKDYSVKDYRNPPGFFLHAIDPHPRKDSIIAVADVSNNYANGSQNNGVHIMRVPESNEDWLQSVHHLPFQETNISNGQLLNWQYTFNKKNLFLKFNHQGNKLAIAHAIPQYTPSAAITIWQPNVDSTAQFTFPNNTNINTIGKPAWDHKRKDFVYVIAGDSTQNTANIYYANTSRTGGTLTRLDWNDPRIELQGLVDGEQLEAVKDLYGRKKTN